MKIPTIAVAAVLAVGAPASADEISEVIEGALVAYNAGDATVAREELDYALKLLNEVKAAGLVAFLPPAQPGWNRGESKADGSAFIGRLGGGTTATATFHRDGRQFTLTLIAHSPMVSGMAAMFTGLAGAEGGETFRVQSYPFVLSQGQVQGVVAEKVLVTVDGKASIADVRAHLEAMDMAGLAEF